MRAVCLLGRQTSIGQKPSASAQIQFVRYARNMTRKTSSHPAPRAAKPVVKAASDPMADISAREAEMAEDIDVSNNNIFSVTVICHFKIGIHGDGHRLCMLRCHYLLFS